MINFLLLFWIFSIPYSHTPSIIHPILTIHGILSICLILVFLFKFITNKKEKYFKIFLSFVICVIFVSVFINIENFSPKTINYIFAYLWFLLYISSIYYFSKYSNLSYDKAIKVLLITTLISTAYCLVEEYCQFLFIDLGSFLPRYDRNEFIYDGPLYLYRIRGFNYEAANLAMMSNVVCAILFSYYRKISYRFYIFLLWLILMWMTFSAFQIVMFFLFFVFLTIYKIFRMNILYITSSLIFLVLCLVFYEQIFIVLDYIVSKNSSISGDIRTNLFNYGVNIWNQGPFLGTGFAYFLKYIDGFNNFYLAIFVQMGVLGIAYVLLLCYFFIRVINTKNVGLIWSFVFAYSHLFFIGDFWLPQLFVPIMFAELYKKRGVLFEKKNFDA